MQRNRSRDTSPEVRLRKALREAGFVGYRLHRRNLPGTPDVAFIGKKVAVFVHGCFWHGCPNCSRNLTPKANAEYWAEKIAKNRDRHERAERTLEAGGWQAVTLWECELKRDIAGCVERVSHAISCRLT